MKSAFCCRPSVCGMPRPEASDQQKAPKTVIPNLVLKPVLDHLQTITPHRVYNSLTWSKASSTVQTTDEYSYIMHTVVRERLGDCMSAALWALLVIARPRSNMSKNTQFVVKSEEERPIFYFIRRRLMRGQVWLVDELQWRRRLFAES